MAGRSRVPHVVEIRDQPRLLVSHPPLPLPPDHRLRLRPLPGPLPPHPTILAAEERLAAQNREIQALLLDNQRLAATHVALKQELNAAQHDLRLAVAAAARARAEREAEVRMLHERSVRAEDDARLVDEMRDELAQLRADVQKLSATRDELIDRLQGLNAELARARTELAHAPAIRAEIEAMHHEVQRGRAAVEFEKKTHAHNIQQSEIMEKNMISMAREVKKLRAELDNTEKKAQVASAAAAAAAAAAASNPGQGYNNFSYADPKMIYGGSREYVDTYGVHQGVPAGASQYGSAAAPHGQYNIQQNHAQ